MIPLCPNCNKLVIGSRKECGKIFCPHCKNEIVVFVKNKYIFVIFFILAMLPFVFQKYSFLAFNIHGHFNVYLSIYLLVIFIFSIISVIKNVEWKKGEGHC